MKYLIASDIHGSAYWCRELLAAWDREEADRLILLGDLLYHGPRNALPKEYDPAMVAAQLNARSKRILCVRGNCDSEVDQAVLTFPILAEYALLDLGDRLLFITHGDHYNADALPPLHNAGCMGWKHSFPSGPPARCCMVVVSSCREVSGQVP